MRGALLRRAVLALAAWGALAEPAAAGGRWNLLEGSYTDELDDTTGLVPSLLQAVAVANGEASIPSSWRVVFPSYQVDPAAATGVDFSSAGSATTFTAIPTLTTTGGAGQERVELLRKWFSAADDMKQIELYPTSPNLVTGWINNCKAGGEILGDTAHRQCLLFPVDAATGPTNEAARGARSLRVLDCPDVRNFNQCQLLICSNGSCKTQCPGASGDSVITELAFWQRDYRDFIVAGQTYNATWFVRSPGRHQVPPPLSNQYNDRLMGFEMSFSYTDDGGGWVADNYVGGATARCSDPNAGIGCLDPKSGCPVRVQLGLQPPPLINAATLYLQSAKPGDPESGSADSVYTPYAFSFCAGVLKSAPPAPCVLSCRPCSERFSGSQQSEFAMCPPEKSDGIWRFLLRSENGAGEGDTDQPTPDCPSTVAPGCGAPAPPCASGSPVPCWNDRASASLYVDGMMLSVTRGTYRSATFDAISPLTRWTGISWDTSTNLDRAGQPRTPIDLGYRVWSEPAQQAALPYTPRPATTVEADSVGLPLSAGRFFQFTVTLTGWDENAANLPPPPSPNFCATCLRYSIAYDGSLSPVVRRIAATYDPFAGRFVSVPVRPARMKRWRAFRYEAAGTGGGATVTADLGVVTAGVFQPVMAGAASGASLETLDPGAYPALSVRFTLDRGTDGSANPRVRWFRLEYEPMTECLALSRNVIRQSRAEGVDVRYCVEAPGRVTLTVHDTAGQLVRTLLNADREAGDVFQEHWDGTGSTGAPVAPGVYFVTAVTPTVTVTKRVAVAR